MLATGAGRPVGVDADIGFVDVDVDRIVDHRIDPDRGEGRVPPRLAVIGRDPHKPVDAGFGLHPAIGVVALDEQRGGLDTRLFAGMLFQDLNLELGALGPAHVHALQHRRPVLALGAAGARMNLDIGVVGIGLAGEERLDLPLVGLGLDLADRSLGFLDDLGVLLLLAHGDEFDIVLQRLVQAVHRADGGVQELAFAHELLRFGRIVPDGRIFRLVVQQVEAFERFLPVKDASSAGLWPA